MSNRGRPLLHAIIALAVCRAVPALGDETLHVRMGSTWRYLRGTAEASSPDPAAWRARGFSDASWSTGAAPFGYGDPPLGTDLSLLAPPMEGNYSTLFLRQEFQVADPALVTSLELTADHDDGFIAWINGSEALRVNVAGQRGDPVAFDGLAAGGHESGTPQDFVLADPQSLVVAGRNVLAVMVFNVQIDSSDLKLDLELRDPFGPDLTPPSIASLAPGAGAVVRALDRIEALFDEDVVGVNASDLLVRGQPAASVSGSGRGPYVFTFPAPAPGTVNAAWSINHGITDLANPANAFAGGSWSYLLDPQAGEEDLAIEELLARGRGGLLDEDGEPSDWIEIRNRGPAAVSLAGWTLSDEEDDPRKWTFPARTLASGERLVVFASGKDRRPAAGPLHASFQLGAGGEFLGLFDPSGRRASAFAPRYPEQRTDISYGVDATGARGWFETPTPGAPNGAASTVEGFVVEPRPGLPRGFYDEPIAVELFTATPGASIRYTLDGSEPTATRGTPYSGPIAVAGSPSRGAVVLRAVAHRPGWLPSKVVTATYVFPEEVLAQSDAPAGFPSAWGAAPAVDYGMDPEVVSADPDAVMEALLSIPSISLALDVNELFGPGGIYSNPGGQGPAWERSGSVEMIDPAGRKEFQADCGIRIQGGASREPLKSPKHSFRLLFQADHGPSKLEARVFDDTHVRSFDVLVLRGGFNNSWLHWAGDQRNRAQSIRDQFARDTQLAMGRPSAHGTYVHLYLNGLYWGLYDLVERPAASFAASYLGGEREDYDAINAENTLDGDRAAWNTAMSLANAGLAGDVQYAAFREWVDVPNLIDYMVYNIWAANQDWPSHNWYVVRRRAAGAGWIFLSWDAERTLETVSSNSTGVNQDGTPARLYSQLRASSEFRLLFADHLQRHFFGSGALTPARTAGRWMARAAEIDRAVLAESARWGDYRRDVHPYSSGPYELYLRAIHWVREQARLLAQYFPQRTGIVLDQFRAIGLYPAVGAPVPSPAPGEVAAGTMVSLSLPAGGAGDILYTLDGSDPRVEGSGEVSPVASFYSGSLVASDLLRIRARVLSGATWSALAEAVYTLPAPANALRISEVHYHPAPEGAGGGEEEFIELWNSAAVTLDLSGMRFTEGISWSAAPATYLGPGERLVLAASAAAFAARYPAAEFGGVYEGSLSNGGEEVVLEDAAGIRVLSADFDDEGEWPLGPDGFGWSLVMVDAGGALDPDDPRSWRASAAAGGSPGDADPAPAHGGVVLSEVLARPPAGVEPAIELLNLTGRDIDIGGWFLGDGRFDIAALRKHRLLAGTFVPAGGYRIIPEAEFAARFRLNALGGEVYLTSAGETGSLTGHITGIELGASSEGVSQGRHPTSRGVDHAALAARTLGAANGPPRVGPVIINEVHYHPAAGGDEFLELFNVTAASVTLHDAASGRGWRVRGLAGADGEDFEMPAGSSIAGKGYLLLVGIDPAAFRARNGVPPAVPVVGPVGGALDGSGERIALLAPVVLGGLVGEELIDQVRYDDRAPWPIDADGGGPSLERVQPEAYGNEPASWEASVGEGGTPGRVNSRTPPGNQHPIASIHAAPERGMAPLEVSFDGSASYDPDGAVTAWEWDFGDGETASGPAARHTYRSAGIYTAWLEVVDALGARTRAQAQVLVEEDPATGGRRLPGDANNDARLDIADPVAILLHLFSGGALAPPCGDASPDQGGSLTLLDASGDGALDLADAIHLLAHLYRDGPAPARGLACVRIRGCTEGCP